MPRQLFFAVITMLFVAASAEMARAVEPPTQTESEKLLVGKWFRESSVDGISMTKATATYEKDGTLSVHATITRGELTSKVTTTGTWKVTGSKLTLTLTKSDALGAKIGGSSTSDILEINENALRIRDPGGIEQTYMRVVE